MPKIFSVSSFSLYLIQSYLSVKKIILQLFLLTAFPFSTIAQNAAESNSKIDSLEKVLLTNIHDTIRVETLYQLGSLYRSDNNYNIALKKLSECIEISRKNGLVKDEARALVTTGNIYNITRKQADAINVFLMALKLREKEGNKKGIATVYIGLGNTYSNMGKDIEALKYYNLCLKIRQEIGDKNGIASAYLGIGNSYMITNDLDNALLNYTESLKIKAELNDKEGLVDGYNNLGILYEMKGDYEKSISTFKKVQQLSEELGDKHSITACYLNLGQTYLSMKNYAESKKYFDAGLKLGNEVRDLQWLKEGYSGRSDLYYKTGKYKEAYDDYLQHIAYRDSISNKENTEQIVQLQMQYDFDKKQEEEKLIQEKKDAETTQAARTQKIVIATVSIVLLIVLVFSVLLLKRIRLTREQKQIIEEKNRDITDSINYAKRIQQVMLPDMEIKNRLFPEAFILFQPKDIVSGDFYWFTEKNGKKIIAAVDCTGHGVPGAFMSMIGNAFLNEIINEKAITSPELILNELRHMVIHSLKQTGADGESRDGMDIAILTIDDKKNIVEYAGANNPLWYLKEGDTALTEIKADKRPIGYFRGQGLPFTLHIIPFKKGDSFYIFTDGYADQFGGQKGKKFKYSQLKEQILSIQNKSMSEQENILLDTFNKWKGHLEQIDDVLVIGVNT